MIVFVEVPLGIELARHERSDFHETTVADARAVAAAAEENLGDPSDPSDATLTLSLRSGEGAVVFDRHHRIVGRFGRAIPTAAVSLAAHAGSATAPDLTVVSSTVGEAGAHDGLVVFGRSSEGLDHRLHALELALVLAALAALAVGAAVAVVLARWVVLPLGALTRAATVMGDGELDVRTDADNGPPEVRALAAEFNVMADRVESVLDAQRMMTMDVSHQLRTPLAALRLRLENVAADAAEETRSDILDALTELARLSRLADGLLAIARAEEVGTPSSPINTSDLVAERVDLWQPLAEERGIEFVASTSAAVAIAGVGHLEQILDNLIANALEAMPRGARLEIRSRADRDEVEIVVQDNGPGLPAAARDEAFRRFAQGGNRAGSTGVGLAIVARLVYADRGTVALAETPGGGLTVTVRLPRA